tara:strand:+ start:2351 stop:3271 length:921 start_codon:yes stop_codon:yes gene_type:complete
MRNSIVNHLEVLAAKDSDIMLLVGDLGFGVIENFKQKFPKQFINVGVAEQNLTGVATGLGLIGKKSITYSIGNFNTFRCLEQIRNDALYHQVNLTIVSIGGGFSYGQLGYSHHATEDYGVLNTLPEISIYTPGSKSEAILCIENCLNNDGVSYLRIDKSHFHEKDHKKGLPKDTNPRELFCGDETLIIGVGGILEEAFEVVNFFKEKLNKNIGLVSLPKIKPLNKKLLLNIMRDYKNIITLEEHNLVNGISSIIKEVCFDNDFYPNEFHSFGINDLFSSVVGDQKFLRKENKIDSDSLIKYIRSLK